MFKVTDKGVILSPTEIVEKSVYSSKEWKEIEKLVAEKGKVYKTSAEAKKPIKSMQ